MTHAIETCLSATRTFVALAVLFAVGTGTGIAFATDSESTQAAADQVDESKCAGSSVSVSRDSDGNITIVANGESRSFKLVEGKIPADVQEWLDEKGVKVTIDGDKISARASSRKKGKSEKTKT